MMLPSTARRSWRGLLPVTLCVLSIAVGLLGRAPAEAWWVEHVDGASPVSTERGAGSGGAATAPLAAIALAAAPPESPDDAARTAPAEGVRLSASTNYYDVEGLDLPTLLLSLRLRGPRDGSASWAANTAWAFRWSYVPVADGGCHIGTARVDLDLAYTYPRWAPPADVAPAVVTAWNRYLTNVEVHEHGHRDIAEAAAADLVKTLQALPAQATCDDLAVTARTTASQLLARHAEAQRAYDQETGHGAVQGAVLTPDF